MEPYQFYFFDIIALLNKHNILEWTKVGANYHQCQLTREFYVKVIFFENYIGNNVFDLEGFYEYRTIENEIIKKYFNCRITPVQNVLMLKILS